MPVPMKINHNAIQKIGFRGITGLLTTDGILTWDLSQYIICKPVPHSNVWGRTKTE